MAILQPIINIAEILAQKGVTEAVISPGSRNAPLTIALVRHPKIRTRSISDERSAAFIAMGMAQVSERPVAICCTSGSAAYNYAPAVAEAFFQEIPLIILTADRPAEWIHQHDGQTIFQDTIFGKHVKASWSLGADYTHPDAQWHIQRVVNEAVNLANAFPKGPVHINVPLREPFYPTADETIRFEPQRIIERFATETQLPKSVWFELLERFQQYDKILIAGGQDKPNEALSKTLQKLQEEFNVVVLGDVITNLQGDFITKQDLFINNELDELAPELLITFGKSFISKAFKGFIRNNKPVEHWHLQLDEHLIDTFQSLTHSIPLKPEVFFDRLLEDLDFEAFKNGDSDERDGSYLAAWQKYQWKAQQHCEQFLTDIGTWHELYAYKQIIDSLPHNCQLHVANSMAVRYTNHIGIDTHKNIEVFANRGTSGIDGCVSTAVGAALATDQPVYLLVGDVAFFYDRNALWNIYLPANLKIILMNNHGGVIFRMIDGPSKQPELEGYFETQQNFTAELTAKESGLDYFLATNFGQLTEAVSRIMKITDSPQLLEVQTDAKVNAEMFKQYKRSFVMPAR